MPVNANGKYESSKSSENSQDFDTEPLLEYSGFLDGNSSHHRHVTAFGYWLQKLRYRVITLLLLNKISKVERTIGLDGRCYPLFFPPNIVKNTKYNIVTAIPKILFDQFKYFFNSFYLVVALAQFIPIIKVGPHFTYIAPLSLVLATTIAKELYDDYKRYLRDKEINLTLYERYNRVKDVIEQVPAQNLSVGDLVQLHTDQRVPCDMVLLCSGDTGTTFVRTDQLDGETDWKLRRAVSYTQRQDSLKNLVQQKSWIIAEAPRREIYDFVGTFYTVVAPHSSYSSPNSVATSSFESNTITHRKPGLISENKKIEVDKRTLILSPEPHKSSVSHVQHAETQILSEALFLEHMLWASTVITCGPVIGIVIYTGKETRISMNSASNRTKSGIFNHELNQASKILFLILLMMSWILVLCKGLRGIWFIYLIRFMLLLSSIIPISLRVNIDFARIYYSYLVGCDQKLPQVFVRNSLLPEELGRIDILLTDKTGTLTCNDMTFKQFSLGSVMYSGQSLMNLKQHIAEILFPPDDSLTHHIVKHHGEARIMNCDREGLRRMFISLAVCHTVTPVLDEQSNEISFQASSPDEIASTLFSQSMGLRLVDATEHHIKIVYHNIELHFEVLYRFPFSSETKRMGCIVKHVPGPDQTSPPIQEEAYKILFFLKGAETAIAPRLKNETSDWLQEECDNFARSGLRTLVFAVKVLTENELYNFAVNYKQAQNLIHRRAEAVQEAFDFLATSLTLIGLTGVEDKLQPNVPETLEALRQAGIKIWMLTGDKIEAAISIAVSAGLKAKQHSLFVLTSKNVDGPDAAETMIDNFMYCCNDTVIAVDGTFVELALTYFPQKFITAACKCPAVIYSRCSPTQKAQIAIATQKYTGYRVCAIGDGGNDVSLIQAANCGIGIVGKEGRQASLAADYSVTEFSHIHRLLFWHGRLSYQRSAKLSQFVIHRGLIISVIQALFSAVFYFTPMAIFQGWLTVGYATYYTMMPIFSLVLDQDLSEPVVFLFPELYGFLKQGRNLSPKTMFTWLWISVYQGTVIMLGALLLFDNNFTNIVSITFTSLILAELLNVAYEINRWHKLMILAEILSVLIYFISIILLPNYFNHAFIVTFKFWQKVGIITLVSFLPLYCIRKCVHIWQPTQDSKLIMH